MPFWQKDLAWIEMPPFTEKTEIFKKLKKISKFLSTAHFELRLLYRFISFSKKFIKQSTF